MKITRRRVIALSSAAGIVQLTGFAGQALAGSAPRHALYGTWHVRCPQGHVDIVEDGTRQHKCKKCDEQCFVDNKVTVMCPNQHGNVVNLANVDVLKNYKCSAKVNESVCGKECEGWR